jgi:hypothetical protein
MALFVVKIVSHLLIYFYLDLDCNFAPMLLNFGWTVIISAATYIIEKVINDSFVELPLYHYLQLSLNNFVN